MSGNTYVKYPTQPAQSGSSVAWPVPVTAPSLTASSGGSSALYDQYGNAIPGVIDVGTFYQAYDFVETNTVYATGNAGANSGAMIANGTGSGTQLTGLTANYPGVMYAFTSSSSAGGNAWGPNSIGITKSSVITWQWRILFMMPTLLSTAANRYTLYLGAVSFAPGNVLQSGPFLTYTDNVNGGNWVLNSGCSTGPTTQTITSVNTAVAVPAASTWHQLMITLVNGVYTFVLDETTLGTVTDANIVTNSFIGVSGGASIGMYPNTAWTTLTLACVDRADLLITGLSR